jgi:hypothetical protein
LPPKMEAHASFFFSLGYEQFVSAPQPLEGVKLRKEGRPMPQRVKSGEVQVRMIATASPCSSLRVREGACPLAPARAAFPSPPAASAPTAPDLQGGSLARAGRGMRPRTRRPAAPHALALLPPSFPPRRCLSPTGGSTGVIAERRVRVMRALRAVLHVREDCACARTAGAGKTGRRKGGSGTGKAECFCGACA